jgi:multiple sugar transport system substrate-binding protein
MAYNREMLHVMQNFAKKRSQPMKKAVILSLCFLLIVPSVFAGGGREAEGDQVTIEYWHINTEAFGRPGVRRLVDEFHEQNPDIRVVEVFAEGAYTQLLRNLTARVAANRPPDVAQIGYLFRDAILEYPYVPIDQLAARYGGREHLAEFEDHVMELGRVKGIQVGMPYSLSNMVMYYNADLMRRAGVDPDNPFTTWDDWRAAAQALVSRTGVPVYLQFLNDNWHTEVLIRSNGGQMLICDADGYFKSGVNSPEAVEAIQFWANMVQQGLAMDLLWHHAAGPFASQEIATFGTTVAYRATLERMVGGAFELRAAPMPSFGDKPKQLPGGGNFLTVFSQDARRQEAAWRFVQFLTSRQGFTVWTQETGYVPLLPDVADDPAYLRDFIANNPIQRVAIAQLANTVSWTSYPGPNGVAAQQALHDAIERAFRGMPAQTAMNQAAAEINALIEGQRCR